MTECFSVFSMASSKILSRCISGVEDNAISFLGEQVSNVGNSAVTLLDSALSAFGYK
ncbi:hypothetical protein SAR03_15010 [Staphylococcus arlettae]|uniref:Uncharacterized protein n=1 Tax=Staphylococcus arlettae TaxID=29378 RepID=A0ABQ0XUS0_9STAP|nr:hypothetical protein [Staphylococcus arlettae]GEQ00464.1 hypothetical protein SAR03_15010 [Staphylococcus arlettae]